MYTAKFLQSTVHIGYYIVEEMIHHVFLFCCIALYISHREFLYIALQSNRARRNAELQLEESIVRIKDLTTINSNISATKSRMEQEISVIAADYDEVTKELRVSISFCFSLR